jgi:hypothetical protein
MKLSNKVKNALTRFIDKQRAEHEENDGYHKINITEPEFGHIIIDITERRTEVKAY